MIVLELAFLHLEERDPVVRHEGLAVQGWFTFCVQVLRVLQDQAVLRGFVQETSQAEAEGLPMAEVVRRALDQVMEEESWEPEPTR